MDSVRSLGSIICPSTYHRMLRQREPWLWQDLSLPKISLRGKTQSMFCQPMTLLNFWLRIRKRQAKTKQTNKTGNHAIIRARPNFLFYTRNLNRQMPMAYLPQIYSPTNVIFSELESPFWVKVLSPERHQYSWKWRRFWFHRNIQGKVRTACQSSRGGCRSNHQDLVREPSIAVSGTEVTRWQ